MNRHTVRLLAALCALLALPALAAASTSGRTAIPSKPESGTFQMRIEPWLGYGIWYGLLRRSDHVLHVRLRDRAGGRARRDDGRAALTTIGLHD